MGLSKLLLISGPYFLNYFYYSNCVYMSSWVLFFYTTGGLVFAQRMRKRQYVTMFDPFQQRYNNVMVALLYLAAIAGDIFWSASILAALGRQSN